MRNMKKDITLENRCKALVGIKDTDLGRFVPDGDVVILI